MRFLSFISCLLCVSVLAGCFGEDYDFSPPTVSLFNPDDITQETALEEANVEWDFDEQYNKKTDDVQALAKKQEVMHFNSGQKVQYILEAGHFDSDGVSVSVWKNDSETKLKLEKGQSFYLPEETGEYVIVFDLDTDKGDAQYVGNIVVE
ncbi:MULTISPECIES: hypothetical protein [Bacillus]|uniref:Uncharacterized protein n=2 Tax=Bacillus infantis TaxID=324767 RepID=A0A5D4SJV7_9BACI|nr:MULTISPECIES: hypothetical protein [Bacillus]MDT0160627.1 hypothetical protein [Bacillus sp. AG4(2022)]TYS61936.1 hypothetical protein FZD47_17760 [Bacillus infantis]